MNIRRPIEVRGGRRSGDGGFHGYPRRWRAGIFSGDNVYALKLVDDRLPVIPFAVISIKLALLLARALLVSLT